MADDVAQITIQAQNDASAQIQEVASDLERLNSVAGTSTPAALGSMRTGVVSNTEAMQGFKDALREVAPEIGRFGDGTAIAIGAAAAAAIEFTKSSVEMADKIEMTHNRAEVVYGTDMPEMTAKTQELADTMHRSANELLGMVTGMTAMTMSMGLGKTEAENTGLAMSALAIDMEKVFGVDAQDAVKSLQMALMGSSRALRDYGIDLTESAKDEWLHKEGIDAKFSSLNDAQKAYITSQYLLEKMNEIEVTADKNTGNFTDSVASLKGAWGDLEGQFGKTLLPTITEYVHGLSSMLEGLAGAIATVQDMMNPNSMEEGQYKAESAGLSTDLTGTDKKQTSVDKYKQSSQELAKVLAGLGGTTSAGAGAAQKLSDEMAALGDQYTSTGERIQNAVSTLEATHTNKMASLDNSIRTAMASIRNLGQTWQTEMDRINETKVDKVADQMKVIQDLKDKVAGNESSAGGLSQDQLANIFVSWKNNRVDKNSQVATAADANSLGISSSELTQINDFIKLQQQQGALTDYTKSHPDVSTKQAQTLSQETGFTRETAKIDEEQAQKTKDYQKNQQQKQDEIKTLQAKRNEEIAEYTSARNQYAQTQTAFTTFHDDYVSKIQHMAAVTKSAVTTMKQDLKDLAASLAAVKPSAAASAASSTMDAIARATQLQSQY